MFGNMFEAPREDHSEQEEIELNDKILAELEPQIGAVYALDVKRDLELILVSAEREDGSSGYAIVGYNMYNPSEQEIQEIGGEEVVRLIGY